MPALVTFHERLMAHLPAVIDAALETSGAAYDARRPRAVEPRPLSVPIELVERAPAGRGGGHNAWRHRYRLRIRRTDLDAVDRTGARQIEAVAGHAAAIEAAFAHKRVLLQQLGDVIVVCDATVEGFDEEPEDEGGIECVMAMTFFTHGTGDVDGTLNPGG